MIWDLRLALRALRRQPAPTIAVVLTVGLAVAANTALFSIFDGLVFRPLPYRDADRIVHVEIPSAVRRVLPDEERDRADAALVATPLLADRFAMRGAVLFEDGAADVEAWNIRPSGIEPAGFAVLGARPLLGRLLTEDDIGVARPAPRPVLLRESLWRSRLGADPALIDQVIEVPGVILRRPLRLVGVLPDEFRLPDGANLWVAQRRGSERLANFARLAPGATIEQVAAAVPHVAVTPLRDYVRPEGAFALAVLLAATGLLLLVAWVQVAALLFARAVGRTAELGVRLALGASRRRLMRQFAAESFLVAVAALAVAWVMTPALTTGIIRLLPEAITRGQTLTPDLRALFFSGAVSIAGVVLLSLMPIEVVRRASPLVLIRSGDLGHVRRGAGRLRAGMLVAQLALTTVLVYMAGLATHSFTTIGGINLGFDPDDVVAIHLPPVTVVGSSGTELRAHLDRQRQQWQETFVALGSLQGVEAAAAGLLPFSEWTFTGGGSTTVAAPGLSEPISARQAYITPDYVRVMRLTVTEGRVPTEDAVAGEGQAVVNTTLARLLEPAGPAMGQRVELFNGREFRIVAVVDDFVHRRPDQPVEPLIAPLQRGPQGGVIVARLDGTVPHDIAVSAIGATFDRIWPENPSREVLFVSDLADRAIADYRARAVLLGLIGVLCVPLALTGIAGALSYATSERLREIGIRLALGARPGTIRATVLRRAFAALGAGLVAGLAGGALMGRLMSSYLFGVRPLDATTVAGVVAALAVLTYLAAVWPANRAARVGPAEVLRR